MLYLKSSVTHYEIVNLLHSKMGDPGSIPCLLVKSLVFGKDFEGNAINMQVMELRRI